MAEKRKTTQRAYTLRLHGEGREDTSWRDALWRTHEAVNLGAWVFGDWLLTLRGGLSHELADEPIPGEEGQNSRQPTDDERRNRRILLALSWLSVESERGAPEAFIIASGSTAGEERTQLVVETLRSILSDRKVAPGNAEAWISDCTPTLSAAIRGDAVWVNRSKAFDGVTNKKIRNNARKDAQTLLWHLFKQRYLDPINAATTDEEENQPASEDIGAAPTQALRGRGVVPLTNSATGAGERTRHVFSHIFGLESTSHFDNKALHLRNHWREHLTPLIAGSGVALRSPSRPKRDNSDPSPTEIHREMFSKAASRLAQIWTKQKQQVPVREQRRRSAEKFDARKNDEKYKEAFRTLDKIRAERKVNSGSLEDYQIARRAIGCWRRVVEAWKEIHETDPSAREEKRKLAAKRIQGEDPDEKFGDIKLFLQMAECEFEDAWLKDGEALPEALEDYVSGQEAKMDAARLKVASYRHPDPYFNPVFCQFGTSRPKVTFGRLEARGGCVGHSTKAVELLLVSDEGARKVCLRGVSGRFDREIGDAGSPGANQGQELPRVTRRSRLGGAAMNGSGDLSRLPVASVFDRKKVERRAKKSASVGAAAEKESQTAAVKMEGSSEKKPSWNATLQSDRRELAAIGRITTGDPDAIRSAQRRLKWWLTVSLELEPKGPGIEFAKKIAKEIGVELEQQYEPVAYVKRPGPSRGKQAKLNLARLPGLRVLGVDLGHRYAAACAVWETVSGAEVARACEAAGQPMPAETDLYVHLAAAKDGSAATTSGHTLTVIYRRIGADRLPDGSRHPAPWARLDRQFLIKLQGEETCARKASNDEIWDVHEMEAGVGRAAPLIDRLAAAGWAESSKAKPGNRMEAMNHWRQRGWQPTAGTPSGREANPEGWRGEALSVDELMSSAVRSLRLGLRRHGDRARIAYLMTAGDGDVPGGERETRDKDGPTKKSLRALLLWHALFRNTDWRDDDARELWERHIRNLPGYTEPTDLSDEARSASGRAGRTRAEEALRDAATALSANGPLREHLHAEWERRWAAEDEAWRPRLLRFRKWVLPRGKSARNAAIRGAGGLSLTRLATITEFRRKVQVGFYTRQRPDGTRAVMPERFGQKSLDTLEHLREQRVKQLASRIAEAALGVGRVRRDKGRDPARPVERVDEACHAVVIENLTHYRPEETRTRRENRQLMSWSSSRVKKHLTEACELHGLLLQEVSAAYTSRQDSRTGAPGMRCQDVPVAEFMRDSFWQEKAGRAANRDPGGGAAEAYLACLNQLWASRKEDEWKRATALRIPRKGGEIFVSAHAESPAARGLQADLNAAANIGLAALLDPDWPGKWWRVPCDANGLPIPEKVKGSAAAGKAKKPLPVAAGKSRKAKGQQESAKGIVNLWRDISGTALQERSSGEWLGYEAYWDRVECRVIRILRERAGIPDEDVMPF